jgi:hypothetical protein
MVERAHDVELLHGGGRRDGDELLALSMTYRRLFDHQYSSQVSVIAMSGRL